MKTRLPYIPVPLEFTRLEAEEALRRSSEFLELMRTRRSVRHFSSEPVPAELIENAVLTAASAPSGANQQPWTFVVVADTEVKERLRAAAEHEERLLYEKRASAHAPPSDRGARTRAGRGCTTRPSRRVPG